MFTTEEVLLYRPWCRLQVLLVRERPIVSLRISMEMDLPPTGISLHLSAV